MFKVVLAGALVLALSACNVVPWVAAHKAELAAVGLIAGTVQVVGGALVQVDEVARRAERRLEEEPGK